MQSAEGPPPIDLDLRDSDYAVTPDYSPDGQQIVFAMFRERPSDLYFANVDGSGLRRLTHTGSPAEVFPDWATTP